MSRGQKLMTIALRKPALAPKLCEWYQQDQPEDNRREFSQRCKDFLGNGRKVPHDMRAALDKVEVRACVRAPNLIVLLT
jgi:hypothetical protein